MPLLRRSLTLALLIGLAPAAWGHPYAEQTRQHLARLRSTDAAARADAAVALGYLRARSASVELERRLQDEGPRVRRCAAMALAWCGDRACVPGLLSSLGDPDWQVRQSACIALENVTGMDLPFDALAEPGVRSAQARAWRQWWESTRPGQIPPELLTMLRGPTNLAQGRAVTASTTYKGPPRAIVDGAPTGRYWQTKNVPFPQWCVIDLGKPVIIAGVTVRQFSARFSMTDYEVALSLDGKTFRAARRSKARPTADLTVTFDPRPGRWVKVTSFMSANKTYPTTLFEVEVHPPGRRERVRALRALGHLGGAGAAQAILAVVEPLRARADRMSSQDAQALRAGMRSLGCLRDPVALPWLMSWLWDTSWARYAADALGDLGDARAVPALLAVYPFYGKTKRREDPPRVPKDDHTGLSHVDRMFETPFRIASALARLPLSDPRDRAALRRLAPRLLADLPEDFDGAIVYEKDAHHHVLAHLLDAAGLRQAVCEAAFVGLGQPRRVADGPDTPTFPSSRPRQLAVWLSSFCHDRADVSRLVALLDHRDGYVRINAAKALAYLGDARAVAAIAQRLAAAKYEADYGWSPRLLDEEFADPTPRVREAFARALGRLGAREHTGLLARIVDSDRSAVEVRRAGAEALSEIDTPDALAALRRTAKDNPFVSVRQVAREALWRRGLPLPRRPVPVGRPLPSRDASPQTDGPAAIAFIKGDNVLPHLFQTDPWRQSYITADAGPVYRPGRNIYTLAPPRPDGRVQPLTRFEKGYVAEIEVSWGGQRVVFCRRGEGDPWWHLWEIRRDGTGLRQLTHGPFHDVSPVYLPDGRILFSSSRVGMRDEYHGYPATALHVCDPDGGAIRHITVNTNRDNEPTLLASGHVLFSRLEVFYSRLKTEITLHAMQPDGRLDVVLYGPERRDFWYRQPRKRHPFDVFGWVYSMHRVLRLTQAQGVPDGRVICSTPGGLVLVGPDRLTEHIVPHDPARAFTTPFPLADGRILCASSEKAKTKKAIDVGIYWLDPATGKLTLVYNDPATADYEARPLMARPRPAALAEAHRDDLFTGRLLCMSTHETQEAGVAEHGRWLRVVEGMPLVARHSTQTNPGRMWQNHQGTLARVLGTTPLAPDGSFIVEVPADRLLQLQVLDSDRQVLGNLLTWITVRPGERRSCVGCHEPANTTPARRSQPLAARLPPAQCLPRGWQFRYRAKLWQKGRLRPQAEERLRTVRALNLLAR